MTPGATDTVSCLAFSPTATSRRRQLGQQRAHLPDQQDVADTRAAVAASTRTRARPRPLWSTDGAKIFSAGADKVARMFDMNTNQPAVVAQHGDVVRSVRWLNVAGGVLLTAGWDKQLKFSDGAWTTRSACSALAQPAGQVLFDGQRAERGGGGHGGRDGVGLFV